MVDFCVEAVGHARRAVHGRPAAAAAGPAVRLRRAAPRHAGVPLVLHGLGNETEIITSMGPECMEYFQTAVDMIVQGRVDLAAMVTPRMPWERAAEAFEMYANPAQAEDSLKLTLVL